ncbi:MAG TPA: single-stranded DNA-binding protein [Clostridia bacterium]|nr:single-stranded DNA-binding protein [Clostridia bacterium]
MIQLMATGNLTRDPELRHTKEKKSVCNITIAANREHKDADGIRPTEYLDVIVWERRGEALASILKKGMRVFVQGEPQSYSYTDKNGVKHEKQRLVLDVFEILSARKQNEESDASPDDGSPYPDDETGGEA